MKTENTQNHSNLRDQQGFSLMELLIIVAIVGIIAALAVPNLLAARRASNEASAIATLRSYHSAQATFQTSVGEGNFAGLSGGANSFGVLADVGLLDETFKVVSPTDTAFKSGFSFMGGAYPRTLTNPANFMGAAVPTVTSGSAQTGTRKFVVLTDGVLHGDLLTSPLWYTEVSGNYGLVGAHPIDN